MRKTMKRLLVLWLLLGLVALLSGCDYLEIDKLATVMGVAIDYEEETGKYTMTVEIAKITEDPQKPIEAIILDGEGETLVGAVESVGAKTSGVLYFLHSELIVVGEDAAKAGISLVIDTTLRSAETQRVAPIAVVKGGKGADLIRTKPTAKPLISVEISEAISSQYHRFGVTMETEMYQLYNDIPSNLSSLLPAIQVLGEGEEARAELDGTAVILKDKLCTYLSPEQTKLCLLSSGRFDTGFLNFHSTQMDSEFTLRVSKCGANTKANLTGQRVQVEITVELEGGVPEIVKQGADDSEVDMESLTQDVKQQLAWQIQEVAEIVLGQYGADLYGLGPMLQNNYRREWQGLDQDWPRCLQTAEIVVVVHVRLYNSGIGK